MRQSPVNKMISGVPEMENFVFEYGGGGYQRVDRVRQNLMDITPIICPERALLITESYQQSEGEPFVLRKAKALANIMANMSIYIEDEQLIVGNQASQNRAAPIFPEYSFDWVIEELDQFDKRTGDVFSIAEDTKEKLRGIQTYWKGSKGKKGILCNLCKKYGLPWYCGGNCNNLSVLAICDLLLPSLVARASWV